MLISRCAYFTGAGIPAHTSPECIGAFNKAEGFNVNCVWGTDNRDTNKTAVMDAGDQEYSEMFDSVVMPLARKFDPGLVLVFSGMDAIDGDPTGNCRGLTGAGYRYMTEQMMSLHKPLVIETVGGYGEHTHVPGFVAIAKAMLGCSEDQGSNPAEADRVPSMYRVRDILKAHEVQSQAEMHRCRQPEWNDSEAVSVGKHRKPRWNLLDVRRANPVEESEQEVSAADAEVSAADVDAAVESLKGKIALFFQQREMNKSDEYLSSAEYLRMTFSAVLDLAFKSIRGNENFMPAPVALKLLAKAVEEFSAADDSPRTQAAADFVKAVRLWTDSTEIKRLYLDKLEHISRWACQLIQGEMLDLNDADAWHGQAPKDGVGLDELRSFLIRDYPVETTSFLQAAECGWPDDEEWDDIDNTTQYDTIQQDEWAVDQILQEQASQDEVQYKVLWQGYTEESATWEPLESLQGVKGAKSALEHWNTVARHQPQLDAELGAATEDEMQ